ncbi:trypco2 family protein [Kitasatospora sp. MBT66]|uniref:trypco2 family protein n=1 Tax=Kitasatospora sp. MBT66 TaxID=1444769 RepID=UPI0005B7D42D|nr:trypco2 family protein [Kitasatospora sp. MBT66]
MIELSDMVRELRQQLTTALADGTDEAVRFELGPVQLEATVAVSREGGADAKVRLWVVDASANGKYAQAQTQRITVTLVPRTKAPGQSEFRSVLIGGEDVEGER